MCWKRKRKAPWFKNILWTQGMSFISAKPCSLWCSAEVQMLNICLQTFACLQVGGGGDWGGSEHARGSAHGARAVRRAGPEEVAVWCVVKRCHTGQCDGGWRPARVSADWDATRTKPYRQQPDRRIPEMPRKQRVQPKKNHSDNRFKFSLFNLNKWRHFFAYPRHI